MKNWIRTGILLSVALALGLWAYFGERRLDDRAREKREERRLTRISVDQIGGFTVIINNPTAPKPDTTIVNRVGPEQWEIVHPVRWPGENAEWRAIAMNLGNAFKMRTWVSSRDSLGFYGLNPPLVRLVITSREKGVSPDTLDIGKATPTDNRCYVKYARSDTVFTTDVFLITSTLKTLYMLRDKAPLQIEPLLVQQVSIRSGSGNLRLEREGELWRMTSPLARMVDRDTVNALLAEIQGTRAAGFYDKPEDLKAFGLIPPAVQASIVMAYRGQRVERRLQLGSAVPGIDAAQMGGQKLYYVKDADRRPVMEVGGGLAYNLRRPAEFYWDRHLVLFQRRDINRVSVVTPTGTISMASDTSANWRFESPNSGGVKRWKVNTLVASADVARVARFVEGSSGGTGLDAPRLSVQLFSGTALRARIDFGNSQGGLVYAKGTNTSGPVLVDRQTMDMFAVSVEDFKELPIPAQQGQ